MNRWTKYHHAQKAPRVPPDAAGDVMKAMQLQDADWTCPLPVPASKTSDGIFVATGHEPAKPIAIKDLVGKGAAGQAIKKSGYQANWRSAAASRFLVHNAEREWADVDTAWCGAAR